LVRFNGIARGLVGRGGISNSRNLYASFYGKGDVNHHLGTGFFVHNKIISAVRRVGFVSDRMSYITPKGRWCDIIVLNVHAPTEVKDVTEFCLGGPKVRDHWEYLQIGGSIT
jgi:hypothetical protein